jgi:hypothetical protein
MFVPILFINIVTFPSFAGRMSSFQDEAIVGGSQVGLDENGPAE